ncbi:hypothetical protein CIB93_08950 [Streptomyces sp. WZ.A104]|uniref:hypothetical protein n=1 Tax=Streptomyces sp. WZ.A104 TaxID=2023771 RepID=UPI000BBB92D7|nr:hypothetical protein [Streptomyces sp. WZ.A104]PCG86351.1 hypothetical protein CIB93_08950 [Streptomyces sp. WZ.A104]
MAVTPKTLFRGAIPAAMTVAYTVPDNLTTVITNVVATNPGTSAAMLTLRLAGVPALASVGIAPKGLLTLETSQVLNAGDTIEIQGNAVGGYVHISGAEVAA